MNWRFRYVALLSVSQCRFYDIFPLKICCPVFLLPSKPAFTTQREIPRTNKFSFSSVHFFPNPRDSECRLLSSGKASFSRVNRTATARHRRVKTQSPVFVRLEISQHRMRFRNSFEIFLFGKLSVYRDCRISGALYFCLPFLSSRLRNFWCNVEGI